MATEREQKLVDIMYQVAIMIHDNESFKGMNVEEIAEWVSHQLKSCGFDVKPVGASWGVLRS